MVREEETQKKKGWFSKKKNASQSHQHVSRPPSAATFAKMSPTKSTHSTDDDELPPRMSSGTPTPTSPSKVEGAATPPAGLGHVDGSTPPGASTPNNIPIHAGFDFNAIKEILGKAELKPDELKVRHDNQLDTPPIPTPTNRSASAPRPLRASSAVSPTRSTFTSPLAGPSSTSHNNLSASFRSMSVNDARDEESDSDDGAAVPSYQPPPPPRRLHSRSSYQDLTFSDLQRPSQSSASTTSFAGNGASVWSSSLTAEPDIFSFRTSSLAPPPASPSAYAYSSSPPLSQNPFATFGAPDTGLSFGGADGSITAVPLTSDPWSVPNDLSKKKGGYNPNPWS